MRWSNRRSRIKRLGEEDEKKMTRRRRRRRTRRTRRRIGFKPRRKYRVTMTLPFATASSQGLTLDFFSSST